MMGHRPISATDYLGIWRRRRKRALVCLLLGLAGGYALARTLPAKYTSTATVQETNVAASRRMETPAPEPSASRLSALREQVLTPERLQGLAGRFGLFPAAQNRGSVETPVAEMGRSIALAPGTVGFTISFTAGDARLAQQVCAGIVSLFLQEERKGQPQAAAGDSPSSSNPSAELVTKQLAEAKRKLDAQEAKLVAFKRRHGDEPSGDDEVATRNSLMGYNVQLEAANGAFQRALQERTALTTSIQAIESAGTRALQAAEPANVQALEQELATEQAQLVMLEARYTPDHPDVVKHKSDIAQLQRKVDEAKTAAAPKKSDATPAAEPPQVAQMRVQEQELDRTIQEKTAELSRLQGEIRAARARLENGPALEREFKQLAQDRDAAQTNYNTLLAKQSDMMKAGQTEQRGDRSAFRLVEAANLPATPSFPDPILFTLCGAAGGLGVGLLAVVLGELRDKTLRTEGDIEHYLGLPTLAVIPTADGLDGNDSEGWGGGSRAVRSGSGEKEESVLADV